MVCWVVIKRLASYPLNGRANMAANAHHAHSLSLSLFSLSLAPFCVRQCVCLAILQLCFCLFFLFYSQLCNETTRRELHADSVPPGKSNLASVRQSAFNCTYQYSVYFLLAFESGGFHGYAGMYEIAM